MLLTNFVFMIILLSSFLFLFLLRLDCLDYLQSSSAQNRESPSGETFSSLTSADSGLQLDLEIALGGVSAKIQPLRPIQPCRR